MTRLVAPVELVEALELLAGSGTPVGGGVGLSLARRAAGKSTSDTLVAVRDLARLHGIAGSGDGLRIGAGERLETVAADPLVRAQWPAVAEAAGSVATGRIRRAVTIGGNVAAFDPSHDPPVALVAVGAEAVVAGPAGERAVPLAELSALAPDELLVELRLPRPTERTGSAYEKFLVRGVWEYACVSVAAVVTVARGRTLIRLAVGSVHGGPLLFPVVLGDALDESAMAAVAERAAAVARPWSDVRGSSAYKRRMITVFGVRALRAAHRRAVDA